MQNIIIFIGKQIIIVGEKRKTSTSKYMSVDVINTPIFHCNYNRNN